MKTTHNELFSITLFLVWYSNIGELAKLAKGFRYELFGSYKENQERAENPQKSKRMTTINTMKNTYLSLFFLFCMSISAIAQSIQNGSSVSQTIKQPGKNGSISISYSGISMDGYCKFPKSIYVSYTGTILGKIVKVEYKLSTNQNFETNRNRDSLYAPKTVLVKGAIKQNIGGVEEILATLSEIVYSSGPIFTGWLVSLDSKLGNSNSSSISKTGLQCSTTDIKFSGKSVAFFRIQKDFSLLFDAKPISFETKPSVDAIKK